MLTEDIAIYKCFRKLYNKYYVCPLIVDMRYLFEQMDFHMEPVEPLCMGEGFVSRLCSDTYIGL